MYLLGRDAEVLHKLGDILIVGHSWNSVLLWSWLTLSLSLLSFLWGLDLDGLLDVWLALVGKSYLEDLLTVGDHGNAEVESNKIRTCLHIVEVKLILGVEADWIWGALRSGPEFVASAIEMVVWEDRFQVANGVVVS